MKRVWSFPAFLVAFGIGSLSLGRSEEITILCSGDVMLGGGTLAVIEREGPEFPFLKTVEVIRSADIAVCNLEAPFGREGEPYPKEYTFRTSPQCVEALTYAGFDAVCLANNHIMDYGVEALSTTLSILDEKEISRSGAGLDIEEARQPAIVERGGLRVALLSYSNTFPMQFYANRSRPGTAPGYERYLKEDIPKAKELADFVIVSFHWGSELSREPQDYQACLGRMAVDLGADLVFGHHPHVFQGVEVHKSGIIAYSLGNFVFGSISEKSRGVLLQVRATKEGIKEALVIPLLVRNDVVGYQPEILTGREAESEIDTIRELSAPFGTEISLKENVGVIELP